MRVETRDGTTERRILIGLVTDTAVLGRIASKWDRGLFRSKWSNLVGSWCIKFYERYNKAPGRAVEGLFEAWAEKGSKDQDTVRMVEKFLSSLSDEYEEIAKEANSGHLLDQASEYFNRVRIAKTIDEAQGLLDAGDAAKALSCLQDCGKLEIGTQDGIDVLRDQAAIRDCFEGQKEPLVVYSGDYGRFLGDTFARENFVSITGATKRGKSWFLLDLGWRGMLQRRKVAFFEVGDMTQRQILRRFMIRAAGRPGRERVGKEAVRYPVSIIKEKEEPFATVVHEDREFPGDLDWKQAWKACKSVLERKIKSEDTYLKLSCHPNSSINVQGIKKILQGWERDDWICDILLIDYADILAPPPGNWEGRDKINENWKTMRALSQELHCLVVTATQSDAESYDAQILRRKHFSDDRRKNDHVTAALGLNQTEAEKGLGIYRINHMGLREDEYLESRVVHVASCLALANPIVRSSF